MVAAAGYQEPSLVFLLGTDVAMVDGTDAAEFLLPGGCRFALVEARHERAFLRRADALGLRYLPPQRFDGYNYSIGPRGLDIGLSGRGRAVSTADGLGTPGRGGMAAPVRDQRAGGARRRCGGRRAVARRRLAGRRRNSRPPRSSPSRW